MIINTGIYCIRNKINGKIYIGATNDEFARRKSRHFHRLDQGDHHNWRLQEDYNQYGKNAFEWSILEYIDNYDLTFIKEKDIIKQYPLNKLYNLINGGSGKANSGAKYHGKFYDPIGNIYSITNMNEFCRKHNLNSRHMCEVRDEKTAFYKGWSKVGGSYRPYEFISPDGILYSWIHILERFAKKYGIHACGLVNVKNKRQRHHHGWRRKDTKLQWRALISPDDIIHYGIWNTNEFARQNQLWPHLLHKVYKGIHTHHHGWRLYTGDNPIIRDEIKVGYMELT